MAISLVLWLSYIPLVNWEATWLAAWAWLSHHCPQGSISFGVYYRKRFYLRVIFVNSTILE